MPRICAALNRVDRGIHPCVRGNDNDRQVWSFGKKPRNKIETICSPKAQIQESQITPLLRQRGQRGVRRGHGRHLTPHAL